MRGPVINGKPHTLVAIRILEWDERGRPSKVLIGYDDTTFDLNDGTPNEFMTGFVPEHMTEPKARNN